jgi:hypothetical protein
MRKPVFGRGELRRVAGACRWVQATAAFLPLLKPFLIRRLADSPGLARKVWHLSGGELFRLWGWLKDHPAPTARPRRKRPARGARGS